jgi:hypothetical protein
MSSLGCREGFYRVAEDILGRPITRVGYVDMSDALPYRGKGKVGGLKEEKGLLVGLGSKAAAWPLKDF